MRDVDRNRDRQTGGRRDEGHLDSASHERGLNLAGDLDRLEGLDHPDHGPEESEQRGDVRKRSEPDETALELRNLDRAGVLDRLRDPHGAFLVPAKTGAEDVARGRFRLLTQGKSLVQSLLCDQTIHFLEQPPVARRLECEVEKLPDDDEEAERETEAERPHHEAAACPQVAQSELLSLPEHRRLLHEPERRTSQACQSVLRAFWYPYPASRENTGSQAIRPIEQVSRDSGTGSWNR